jgi:hypothetical protein
MHRGVTGVQTCALPICKIIKFTADKYTSLWTKKSFRDGVNPPPAMVNDTEAITYVRQTPGACSYVATAPPGGVAVVGKF